VAPTNPVKTESAPKPKPPAPKQQGGKLKSIDG